MSISVPSFPRRFDNTLLVCSETFEELETCLAGAGCKVTKVDDGNSAVYKMRRGAFDVVILVSTGKDMDLVETVLNLKDIRPSTQMAVVMNPLRSEPSPAAQGIIARAIPEMPFLTISELQSHLDLTVGQREPAKTAG